jgi:hypothetical protein
MKYGAEICNVLGFNAAYNISFLPTFRGNLSVPSSRSSNPGSVPGTLRYAVYIGNTVGASFKSPIWRCVYRLFQADVANDITREETQKRRFNHAGIATVLQIAYVNSVIHVLQNEPLNLQKLY